jgi:hypothetical protein
MIDGQFDEDRGYIFNYAATAINVTTDKNTAFLMRLAPSVSNAQIGDLGDKELLNRAQLLLSSIACVSDTVSGGGAIVVEGIINPINYPEDPTKITWTGLSSQASGGQPSFAQIAPGGSVSWGGGVTTTTATIQGAFTTTIAAKSFSPSTNSLTAQAFTINSVISNITALGNLAGVFGGTYAYAIFNGRADFFISNSQYDTYVASNTMNVGDTLTSTVGWAGNRVISSITRAFSGTAYTRIIMTQAATATTGINNSQTVAVTNTLTNTYNNAISSARVDFLVPNTQYTTAVKINDILSAVTFIAGGQTLSSFTQSYCRINGTVYARVVMSGLGTVSSTAGFGNTVAVTATSADTATYGRAVTTGRSDFLITDTEYDSSGILIGDTVSAATVLTGGQTITSITRSYTTINSVLYTRIVMSAVANANSTTGSGNDVTVTVTAAGTASSYIKTNYLFFTSSTWLASGASVSTRVSAGFTSFPAGTSVSAVTTRTFGATTVYRVVFTQTGTATLSAAATVTFAFGAAYALPGEQVFSFVSNPGGTDNLSLDALKELTSTAIGGRGTFPNGPDVLAINIYKVAGSATSANVIIRWSEAQA